MACVSSGRRILSAAAIVAAAGWCMTPARAEFPPPPLVTSPEWFDWYDALLAQRLAACPRERSTTFHFSTSGDDQTGNGSIFRPYRTLAKAQQILDAHPAGDVALLFRRGDVWREDRGLLASTPNVTIADYGRGERPLFTAFRPIPREGWRTAGAPGVMVRSEPDTVTWVKQDDNLDRPMVRCSNLEQVRGIEGSWWWDAAAGLLYVHIKPLQHATADRDPAPTSLELVRPLDAGVIVQGNGSRIENIRAWGWGMWTTTPSQQHGIEIRTSGQAQAVAIGCDSYYGSSHAIVFANGGGAGGIATFIDCRAGLCNLNSAGETVFNTYARYGRQETIWDRCVATHGTLPSTDWSWQSFARGRGFFGHASGGSRIALVVMKDCVTRAGPSGCNDPSNFNDLPLASTLGEVRSFSVGEVFEGAQDIGGALPLFVGGLARVNSRYIGLVPLQASAQALVSWSQAGWLINSTVEINLSNITGTYGLYNAASGSLSAPRIWNSAIHAHVPPGVTFRIDRDKPNQSAAASVVNSVFVVTGGGTFDINLGDAPGDLASNAYFGVVPGSFAWDADPLSLLTPPPLLMPPPCSSGMVLRGAALPEGALLGHDATGWRVPRRTLGPFEGIMCLDVDASGFVDVEDLYRWHREPFDLTGDGIAGPEDGRAFESYLREGEFEDMRNGRQTPK